MRYPPAPLRVARKAVCPVGDLRMTDRIVPRRLAPTVERSGAGGRKPRDTRRVHESPLV